MFYGGISKEHLRQASGSVVSTYQLDANCRTYCRRCNQFPIETFCFITQVKHSAVRWKCRSKMVGLRNFRNGYVKVFLKRNDGWCVCKNNWLMQLDCTVDLTQWLNDWANMCNGLVLFHLIYKVCGCVCFVSC